MRPDLSSNLKLSLLSVLLFFAATEGVFRALGLNDESPEHIVWVYDSLLGWKHAPHSHARFKNGLKSYSADIRINSKGLRDDEMSYEKPDGTRRILLLGDSIAAGFEVERPFVIDSVLEKKLSDKWKKPVEVINAGVRGYSTGQELLYLKNEGRRYAPDIVLYLYCDNDPLDNLTIHHPNRRFGRAYFLIGANGSLDLKGTPVPRRFDDPKILLSDAEAQKQVNLGRSGGYSLTSLFRRELSRSEFLKWVFGRFDVLKPLPRWDAATEATAWRTTKALIAEMAKTSREMNARFVVYEFTSTGEPAEKSRLEAVCAELGAEYFNSFGAFLRGATKKNAFHFLGDRHWNEDGHALAASEIAEYL